MKPTDLFTDFQNRVTEALRNSPAADIEKNDDPRTQLHLQRSAVNE